MTLHPFRTIWVITAAACAMTAPTFGAAPTDIVYGGNAAGIVAGIQAKRMGRSVVVIEPSRRIAAADGTVRNEGDVQVHGFTPFRISYRAITPRETECGNLLVPVCLSATHVAYGSIRMEPVFMVLGQSAATAAAQAIDVQRLRRRLAADGQLLVWGENDPAGPP